MLPYCSSEVRTRTIWNAEMDIPKIMASMVLIFFVSPIIHPTDGISRNAKRHLNILHENTVKLLAKLVSD